MPDFTTVDALLDFAIAEEERAERLYRDLASRMDAPHMRQVFDDFAAEERRHRAKLRQVKKGKALEPSAEQLGALSIADYVTDEPAGAEMDYQGALVLAMKAEKAAFRFYTDLAGKATDARVRATLLGLAREEAAHRMRFEIEYESHYLDEPGARRV